MAGEGSAAFRQGVNVWGMNIVDSEAFEFRAEVIDTNKQDIFLSKGFAHKDKKNEEDSHEKKCYESNQATSL